jgi:hypothetical protein
MPRPRCSGRDDEAARGRAAADGPRARARLQRGARGPAIRGSAVRRRPGGQRRAQLAGDRAHRRVGAADRRARGDEAALRAPRPRAVGRAGAADAAAGVPRRGDRAGRRGEAVGAAGQRRARPACARHSSSDIRGIASRCSSRSGCRPSGGVRRPWTTTAPGVVFSVSNAPTVFSVDVNMIKGAAAQGLLAAAQLYLLAQTLSAIDTVSTVVDWWVTFGGLGGLAGGALGVYCTFAMKDCPTSYNSAVQTIGNKILVRMGRLADEEVRRDHPRPARPRLQGGRRPRLRRAHRARLPVHPVRRARVPERPDRPRQRDRPAERGLPGPRPQHGEGPGRQERRRQPVAAAPRREGQGLRQPRHAGRRPS